MCRVDAKVFGSKYRLVFIGPPGAGKSTIISMSAFIFRQRSCSVLTIYGCKRAYLSSLMELFLSKLMFNGLAEKYNLFPMLLLLRYARKRLGSLIDLWYLFDTFGLLLKDFIYRIKFMLGKFDVVLIEDYLPATIMDYFFIAFTIGKKRLNLIFKFCIYVLLSILIRNILSFMGKTFLVYLDASTMILKTRYIKRKRAELSERYIGFLKKFSRILCYNIASVSDKAYCISIDNSNLTRIKTVNILMSYIIGE